MAEVLYHKPSLFGRGVELHIAPEGLTLVGRAGPESVEFAPLSDIEGVSVGRGRRRTDLTVSFGPSRPPWTLSRLSSDAAEWAQAVINEERSAADKLERPEFNQAAPVDRIDAQCAAILASRDGRAAVEVVDYVLAQGVLHGASDVHFDPYGDALVVRYRLDGLLHDVARLDASVKRQLTARLKVVSRLATYKRSIAQEGRAAARIAGRTVDFRFSSIPTIHGEKVCVRIFDPAKSIFALDALGMSADTLNTFQRMLMQPQGMILLTGPSSSGKTTTMYASLNFLREKRKNLSSIATVEDPVEYDLQVVNQTQVNTNAGLTFAGALRTVLRQDPEVIMIGEIRDSETAAIAVQAGLTGHLILSTVHARSAAGVLLRLIDLGVEPYLLASSVTGVLSQRLVRTVCGSCAKPYIPAPDEQAHFGLRGDDRFAAGDGCGACSGTGYTGRTGIFQLLPITDAMRELVLRRASLGELEQQAERERIISLREDGLDKARAGKTTLEELRRVLG